MANLHCEQLLRQMTTREKLAQLLQVTPISIGYHLLTDLTGPDAGLRLQAQDARRVGSLLNCAGAEVTRSLQKDFLASNPQGIPLLFMADVLHGFRTIFPVPLAMGCTFAPALAEQAASIAASESAASGIHVVFAPMADLVRDPRWGRVTESFGEDPLLCGLFAAAMVLGYQGRDVCQEGRVAACVKHFAGYGAPEGGREYAAAELSESTFSEMYLPPYQAAIQAGAKMVMASFNAMGGVPATANRRLLEDVLRKAWGFTGCIISDYNAVDELRFHGVATDGQSAAARALQAGIQIEMMSTHFLDHGESLLQQGEWTHEGLDEAVLSVLELKAELGLFENPYKDASTQQEQKLHLCEPHRAFARECAQKAPVLLKNENAALPISSNEPFCLSGPFADDPHVLGAWSAGCTDGVSLMRGLQDAGASAIHHIPMQPLQSMQNGPFQPVLSYAATLKASPPDTQKIVLAIGEHQNDTGEGASKACLRLTSGQEELVRAAKALGKTVIAVVFSGRPLELSPILANCDAVLQAWFLGTESGNALADLLLGKASPSGKLCMSFPRSVGQIPVYYNQPRTGRPLSASSTRYASRYLDCPNEPLFPFGHGLAYGRCALKSIAWDDEETPLLRAEIAHESGLPYQETVQLYVRQEAASRSRPEKSLKGFLSVSLSPGDSHTLSFPIAQDMLTFPLDGAQVFEEGFFTFEVGFSSARTQALKRFISKEEFSKLKRSIQHA